MSKFCVVSLKNVNHDRQNSKFLYRILPLSTTALTVKDKLNESKFSRDSQVEKEFLMLNAWVHREKISPCGVTVIRQRYFSLLTSKSVQHWEERHFSLQQKVINRLNFVTNTYENIFTVMQEKLSPLFGVRTLQNILHLRNILHVKRNIHRLIVILYHKVKLLHLYHILSDSLRYDLRWTVVGRRETRNCDISARKFGSS